MTDTLYHIGKDGAVRTWRIWVEGDTIFTEYGIKGGELQRSSSRAEPKNVGRSNETTAEEQALKEALALFNHKLKRKYRRTIQEAMAPDYKPMLAKDYTKRERFLKDTDFPADTQPKLDGIRMVAYLQAGEPVTLSRSGQPLNTPWLTNDLKAILREGEVLDGELYVHGLSFQQVTRLVKKYRPGESDNVKYHIYDIIPMQDTDLAPWWKRKHYLDNLRMQIEEENLQTVTTVPSTEVNTKDEVQEQHANYLANGYEGSMLRIRHAPYKFGYRSDGLLKVKDFQDAEYRITGVQDGVGKFEGAAIIQCETQDGQTFLVTPKGTMEERRKLYQERNNLIGSWLKVQYFELTDDGIPRFPIGLGIRLPQDMPHANT